MSDVAPRAPDAAEDIIEEDDDRGIRTWLVVLYEEMSTTTSTTTSTTSTRILTVHPLRLSAFPLQSIVNFDRFADQDAMIG